MFNQYQKSIEMPEMLANEILNYLADRPYKEVVLLIREIQMCRPAANGFPSPPITEQSAAADNGAISATEE